MSNSDIEKILVIEDDPFTRDLLEQELRGMGYEMGFLENGADALEVSAKIEPDLILLDIMMDGIDGFEICHMLKKDTRTTHIPIIFMTAKQTQKDLVHGLSLGANDYITKPFSMEVLAARIETQLRNKRLVDKITKQKQELEKLNTTIKEFMGMASHDLRTPTSVIKLISSSLADRAVGPLTKDQQILVEKIHNQTSYMSDLLDKLLNVTHIESGKISLNIQPEDINHLLRENLSSLSFIAKAKSIDISLQTDPSLPRVPLDKARFTEIFDNIVSNAIKFTTEGGKITVKSTLTVAKSDGTWASISIADTGVGMKSENLRRLFQEYGTLDSTPTNGEKATGLGLWIAKKLTELHNGKLAVHSKAGVGSEFIISLPLE
jgi:signal transduction histidine kinase